MRFFLLFFLGGCSTILPMLGAAGGAAVGSAVGGPGGAAVGAAGGVMVGELANTDTPAGVTVQPSGVAASTVHETTNLIEAIGLWYLLLFVLVPLITKKGRGWVRKFANMHNMVSQKDFDTLDTNQNTKIRELFSEIEKLKK